MSLDRLYVTIYIYNIWNYSAYFFVCLLLNFNNLLPSFQPTRTEALSEQNHNTICPQFWLVTWSHSKWSSNGHLRAQRELQGELSDGHVSCHQMYALTQVFSQIISANLHILCILWSQIKDLRLRPWWWTLVDTWWMNEWKKRMNEWMKGSQHYKAV